MKASELRIGNYIYCKGEIIKVTLIGNHGVQSSINGTTINAKFNTPDLEPIPLTEKWLLDFGFDHMGIIFRKSVTHHLELVYMLSINEFRIQTKGSGFTNTLEIKHVHQLQNLYFALTGEELKIKTTSSTSQ